MRVLIVSDSHGRADLLDLFLEVVNRTHDPLRGFLHPAGSIAGGLPVRGPGQLRLGRGGRRTGVGGGGHPLLGGSRQRHQVKRDLSAIFCPGRGGGGPNPPVSAISHVPVCEQKGSVLLVNPGSIGHPRGSFPPSYALLEAEAPRRVRVSFFSPDGRPRPSGAAVFPFDWRSHPLTKCDYMV